MVWGCHVGKWPYPVCCGVHGASFCHQWGPGSICGPPELLQRGCPSWEVLQGPSLEQPGQPGPLWD